MIRGWTTNRLDRAFRAVVDILIDGVKVAECRADRYDPKLVETGEGDGCYAFAVVVPEAYRDGFLHRLEAVAAGFTLRSKAPTFRIGGAASMPRVEVVAATPELARCRLVGGQYSRSVALELWLDGERMGDPAESVPVKGVPEFVLRYGSARSSGWSGKDVVVAAPGMIEAGLPGARLVVGSAPRPPGEAPPETAGANLVRNADLSSWPNGLTVFSTGEQVEAAEGWRMINHGARSPVRATATPVAGDPETRFGLTLAADEVTEACRLEVELDGRALSSASGVALRFEAACGPAARRLHGSAFPELPEFLLIDRIMLLRRAVVAGGTDWEAADQTLAVLARQVSITRTMRTFEFFAPLVERDLVHGAADYLLVFSFRQPVAITLQRPRLTIEAAPPAPSPQEGLSLEDPDITAHAGLVRGLEHWVSPTVLRAPRADAGASASPEGVERWRWGMAGGRSVEVVVCVHNAPDETLACLASLAGGSSVPHTVRIVDDGSDRLTAARIAAFVADKPWMRVVENPENLGYTASANRGVRESEADWVILLNSDTVVSPGWIEGMLECAASDPEIAFVGPVSNAASCQSVPELYDAANTWKTNALPASWSPARMAKAVAEVSARAFPRVPLLNGFCTLMRRDVFLELGGFNEAAFPQGYGEENDLCVRAVAAGYKLAVADHVYVYHSKSASFGAARRAELAKAGDKALKALRPEVNFGALVARFREVSALAALREAVGEIYRDAARGEAVP